jgi:hypothetical protein
MRSLWPRLAGPSSLPRFSQRFQKPEQQVIVDTDINARRYAATIASETVAIGPISETPVEALRLAISRVKADTEPDLTVSRPPRNVLKRADQSRGDASTSIRRIYGDIVDFRDACPPKRLVVRLPAKIAVADRSLADPGDQNIPPSGILIGQVSGPEHRVRIPPVATIDGSEQVPVTPSKRAKSICKSGTNGRGITTTPLRL